MAGQIVVRGTVTPPDEWSKGNYRDFRLALYLAAKGFGIDTFVLHQDDQIQLRKKIKQLQGLCPAVCREDVKFGGFKNQFSCRKGLPGSGSAISSVGLGIFTLMNSRRIRLAGCGIVSAVGFNSR